jgi:hypothetical protein
VKTLSAVVALVAFLVACAAPVKPPPFSECDRLFVVSPAFPEDEQEALQHAVERWNEIAVEQFCLRAAAPDEVAEEITHGIFRIPYKGAYWQEISKQFGGANVLGIHIGDADRIGIVDSLDIRLFELVALHEFGHAHSLRHTPAPSIMHSGVGTATDFTANDMAECHRVDACRKED